MRECSHDFSEVHVACDRARWRGCVDGRGSIGQRRFDAAELARRGRQQSKHLADDALQDRERSGAVEVGGRGRCVRLKRLFVRNVGHGQQRWRKRQHEWQRLDLGCLAVDRRDASKLLIALLTNERTRRSDAPGSLFLIVVRCPGEWKSASGLLVNRVFVRGECRSGLVRRNAIGQEKPCLGNLLQHLPITIVNGLGQTHAFGRASAEHLGCSQGSLLF